MTPAIQQDRADEDVDALPDAHLADAHEDLRVLGLHQHVVERALLDVLHQLLHVRLDRRGDDAAHQDLDAHHGEQLRLRPAVELGRVRETSDRTARPVQTAIADWKSWTTKFARYCSSFSTPTRK